MKKADQISQELSLLWFRATSFLQRVSADPAKFKWEIDETILEANAARIDEAVHYEQLLEVFCEAMGILRKAHQRAILLRRVYGLSHKEIAKKRKKGVSIRSVEKYFAPGIRRCQDIMSRRGYGVEHREGRPGEPGLARARLSERWVKMRKVRSRQSGKIQKIFAGFPDPILT